MVRKIVYIISLLIFIIGCKTENKNNERSEIFYKCTPCNLDCDTIHFNKAGFCPHCKMKLIPISQKSSLIKLQEYEGKYEYSEQSTINIVASRLDTILYAVVDKAKYPLTYISNNIFTNIQDEQIVFQRNENEKVVSYKSDNKIFKLLTKDFEKMEMLPRKELFQHSDKYIYQQPKRLNDGIEVGNINTVFKNPEPITEMIKKTIDGIYPNIHSILIYKENKLVLEEYFYGYNQNTPHQLRSASKSFVGNLIGIAIDKKFIKSENEKVLSIFENRYKRIENIDKRKEQLTIDDILKYEHGMDCENNNPKSKGNEVKMMQSEDWTKFTLDLPMVSKPGNTSSYCTGCEMIIGDLLEISTKQKIEKFANENLFKPLGITNYKWRFASDKSSMNSFSQMYIRPRDLIKLAKLNKDGGQWNDKQVISKKWTNKLNKLQKGKFEYFWKGNEYIVNGKKYKAIVAQGNGGQKIHIWPELDMITIFTGGNYNYTQIYGKSTPPNEMIPNYILKALE